ncbi:MAG TPA: hypothetical protein VMW60_03390 [Dehalococcoidales bacterium]|nr:hypothetical protein [Dehalococcoidales bacterium]
MMITIECPKCGTAGSQSLLEPDYEGPYRCWKCRELFVITIEGNQVKAWKPLTEEEFQKMQEAAALKAKFRKQSGD